MRLTTERLVLREFTEADWPTMLAQHQDSRYQAQYPNGYGAEQNLRRLLDMFLAWQREEPRYRWQLAITVLRLRWHGMTVP